MTLYIGKSGGIPSVVYSNNVDAPTKLSELENDAGFITNEAIKTTIQSISSTQEEEILNSGTLDGVEVENGKIFACDYGNMKIYSKTETSGDNSGLVWDALGNIGLTEMSPHSPAIEPISGTAVVTIDGYSSAWVGMINGGGPAWERVDDVVSNGFVTGNGSLLSNFPLSDCIHNGVEFIHYGNSYISRSQDGRTWTQEEYPNGSPFMKISGVAVDGNLNYVVSDDIEGKIFHSTDGINFTDTGYKGKVQPPSHGVFIATQDDNHILESHDGLHWNTIDIPMDGMIGAQCIMMNGTYVWIASPSVITQSVYYSTDGGSTWNESLLPFPLNPRLSYCGDKFIILDGSTSRREIVYSYDGINWHTALMDVEDVWYMTYYSYPVCGIAGSHSFETTTSRNWGGSNDSSEQPTYTYSLDTISPNMSDVHLAVDNASYIGVLDTTTVYSYLYNKNEGSICYASEDGEYVLDYTGETKYYKKGHFYKIATMWGGENSEYYIRYFEDITQDDSQYTRKLDAEHAEQIVLDGTFDGQDVEDGEVFVQHNGKLVEFDKTLNPGGEAWNSISGDVFSPTYSHVAYGNNIFVATVNYNPTYVYTSSDGKNWVDTGIRWSDNHMGVACLAFMNDKFVAIRYNASNSTAIDIVYSTDGITWTSTTMPTSTRYWRKGVYGGGKYVFVSGGYGTSTELLISDDGINWTSNTYLEIADWKSICYGDNAFVAVAGGGYDPFMKLFKWTPGSDPERPEAPLSQGNAGDICYGNGKYVITMGTDSTNQIFYSTDGISWVETTAPVSDKWINTIYTGSMFVSVGAKGGNVITSEDGINWVQGVGVESGSVSERYRRLCNKEGLTVYAGRSPVVYIDFNPFYEYSLTDLSFNKTEVEENFALKSELPKATLVSTSVPTTSTAGSIGQQYIDTTNGVAYICVQVDDTSSSYTWKQITN